MKKLFFLFAVLFIASQSFGQFTFGVSPGLKLNSSYFGYNINSKIVPYIGFQFFNAKYNFTETGERYDYNIYAVVSYTDNIEISGNIFVPNLGVKYFAIQQNNLKAYFTANFSKPIISGKIELGDSPSDNDFEDEFVKQIKAVSIWGGEFGFGCEYFFDKNFSVGGEFGFRNLKFKYNDTYNSTFYNPDTGTDQNTTITDNIKINLSPTYSKITLNFYFQKKE